MNFRVDWDQAVAELGPALYRYFQASMGSAEAADLVQESLERLVTRVERGAFDPARGSLRMYAFGVARLVKLEAWRARSAYEEIPNDAPAPGPNAEENLALAQNLSQLRRAFAELAPEPREVLELQIDQELKLEEIAELLNMPLNTVKSHARRGRERLREILRQRGIDHV